VLLQRLQDVDERRLTELYVLGEQYHSLLSRLLGQLGEGLDGAGLIRHVTQLSVGDLLQRCLHAARQNVLHEIAQILEVIQVALDVGQVVLDVGAHPGDRDEAWLDGAVDLLLVGLHQREQILGKAAQIAFVALQQLADLHRAVLDLFLEQDEALGLGWYVQAHFSHVNGLLDQLGDLWVKVDE